MIPCLFVTYSRNPVRMYWFKSDIFKGYVLRISKRYVPNTTAIFNKLTCISVWRVQLTEWILFYNAHKKISVSIFEHISAHTFPSLPQFYSCHP